MPSIKKVNQGDSSNAVNGLDFEVVPEPGALLSLYASCVTAGDTIGLKVGSESFLVDAEPNIEASADVVDTDRDQILFQEPVPAGQIFLPVSVTTALNFIIVLEYLAA